MIKSADGMRGAEYPKNADAVNPAESPDLSPNADHDHNNGERRFGEILEILRQHGTDNPEQVLAQLNQYYLNVHQPDSEYEGLVRAAARMDKADPGSGKRFIRAIVDDYERQSQLQEREQRAYEGAQRVRHWHASIALGVAALTALGVVGGGVYCAVTGNIAGAGILLGGTAAVIIGAFLKVRLTK